MALAWLYRDHEHRYPSLSTDEFCRHTLIVPNPFRVVEVDPEGQKLYAALVLVVAPWWLCRHIFNAEDRKHTKEDRRYQKLLQRTEKEMLKTKPILWEIIENEDDYRPAVVDAAWGEFYLIRERLVLEDNRGK